MAELQQELADKPQWVREGIKAHGEKRRAAFKKRETKALVLKERGNDYFRDGVYATAIRCYKEALKLDSTKPVYFANYCAALLRLELYPEVVQYATIGLCLDPKHQKLRFRRMQARRGLGYHKGALSDAMIILHQSNSTEDDLATVRREIKELKQLIDNRPPNLRNTNMTIDDSDTENNWPTEDNRPEGLEPFDPARDFTDSDDNPHEGNGIPCRFYNREKGCAKEDGCRFSHAPDEMSEPDLLGKNVCKYWLLGICRYDDEKCNYAHTNVGLPPKGWWTDEEERLEVAIELKGKSRQIGRRIRAQKDFKEEIVNRETRNKTSKKKKKKKAETTSRRPQFDMGSGYGIFDSEDEFELMCQGVNPWDEDAMDVLAVLNGDY